MKKNIAIFTVLNDPHAVIVSAVLREMGHMPARFLAQDYPQEATYTFEFENKNFQHCIDNFSQKFDSVWVRRPANPVFPENIHKDDKIFFEKEGAIVNFASKKIIEEGAFSVNPLASARNAENKILQLRAAVECGLTIPKTLISNDPQKIKEFVKNSKNGCIYKSMLPFNFVSWTENKSVRTATISIDSLPSEKMLKNGGGIYQEKVLKNFEIRVTVFGKFIRAGKINSQAHPLGLNDWRCIPDNDLCVAPYDLPDEISNQCFSILDKLGLVMGCFDFIVTPENEHIFLEVNQQGQFLWVEEKCPEIQLLGAFCEFLVSCDPNFKKETNDKNFRYQKVIDGKSFENEFLIERSKNHTPIQYPYLVRKTS